MPFPQNTHLGQKSVIYGNFFYKEDNIKKYGLKDYIDFKDFIQNKDLNNVFKIEYKVPTIIDKSYEESLEAIEKFKKEKFEKKIEKSKYYIDDYGIDNFYITSYNYTLSYLQIENSDINPNFYKNICQPLFKDKVLKALEIFYEPQKYKEITKKYNISSYNIKPFLFGYRYCLNELASENLNGIYYSLYDINKLNYLKDKFYPGNDTKSNLVFYQIINHFKNKPKEGCYVCLCPKMFYLCVPSGFPGEKELNKTCPNCGKNIGCINEDKKIKIVKRNNYCRILKDDEEVKEIQNDANKKNQLKDYMTFDKFKEKYITESFKKEKGILKADQDNFKNINKIVRSLSRISFRLLNYILYSHLFFARVITNKDDFDKYLPKGMTWEQTISQCWYSLKIDLLEKNIESIEEFMYYIFPELFPILNQQKIIDKFNDLIIAEKNLQSKIKELINNFKKNKNIFVPDNKENDEDYDSTINLLTEKYTSIHYKKEDYPFYKYLYYTDYLNENYILEKLAYKDKSQYPILKLYLDTKKNINEYKSKNLLDKLHLFNSTLNLVSQKYFNNISRESAKTKKLKDDEIYISNHKLFDDFIEFYNNLKIKEIKIKSKLSSNDHLNDFFIEENNKFGKTYKEIYKFFINQQNESIKDLLDKKIERGIFDVNCKKGINIQQLNEKEIFTLTLPKKVTFIDILFNSTYRKALNNIPISYKSYKEYEIDYDLLEEIMTNLLLKNKKILNEEITEFIYNNEVFSNQIADIITTFKSNNNCIELILDDKVPIFKFFEEDKNNTNLNQTIINDFIELIKYLNNLKKENNNAQEEIKDDTKLYDIVDKIKDLTSKNFINLFEKNDCLTFNKTIAIFEYFLKIIYECVNSTINEYQEDDIDENTKEKIDNYFQKKHSFNKSDLAYALRLFMSLVLFQEEDKENKIKSNQNNIVNYLKSTDLWKYDINDDSFINDLNELKSINIHINQIISLYDYLGKDIDDNYFDDVEQKIRSETNQIIDNDLDDEENKNKSEDNEENEDNEDKSEKSNNDDDDDRI